MTLKHGMLGFFLSLLAMSVWAQHHGHTGHHAGHSPSGHSAYAGMQERSIKALSSQQIVALREARGMGMALPAELNGYPGPLHVLELATELKLTPEQVTKTQQLFQQMQAQAKALGEALIMAETELDRLFSSKTVTPASLTAAVSHAAQVQGQLRDTHLQYHLLMMDVLTPAQVAHYNKLRGYQP